MKKLHLRRKKTEQREPTRPTASTTFSYYRTSSQSSVAGENPRVGDRRKPSRTARSGGMGTNRALRILHKMPAVFAGMLIGVSIFYMLSLSTNPRVIIASSDVDLALRTTEAYQTDMQSILQKSVFSYTKLTINTDKMAEQIKTEFPEFRDVSVVLPLLNRRPVIHVQPAQPAFVLMSRSGSFVLDTQGRAIMEETRLATTVRSKLPSIQDESQLDIQLTKQVMSQSNVDFITTFRKELLSKDVQIQTITLPTVANEVHFGLVGEKYFVKANLQLDAKQQAGTFLALQNKFKKEATAPSQYIDVRVEERAYYL